MKNLCSFYPESIGNPHPQAILEDLIDFFLQKSLTYMPMCTAVPLIPYPNRFLAGVPKTPVSPYSNPA